MSDQSNDETTNENEENDMLNMSELQLLKRRAAILGITHSNNISVATLRAKIEAKLNGEAEAPGSTEVESEETPSQPVPKQEKELTVREKLRLKSMKLVRCRIQCLDPKKKDLRGEIFTVGNEMLGTVRKFVPFGEVTDGGFHIPHIIYKMMLGRKFVNITITKERGTGREVVKTSMAKEFAIEVLPPLTPRELARLATAQAAAGSVDEVAA